MYILVVLGILIDERPHLQVDEDGALARVYTPLEYAHLLERPYIQAFLA